MNTPETEILAPAGMVLTAFVDYLQTTADDQGVRAIGIFNGVQIEAQPGAENTDYLLKSFWTQLGGDKARDSNRRIWGAGATG